MARHHGPLLRRDLAVAVDLSIEAALVEQRGLT
jgi:hypothetical protein